MIDKANGNRPGHSIIFLENTKIVKWEKICSSNRANNLAGGDISLNDVPRGSFKPLHSDATLRMDEV
jgi:hypothetical protein